MTRFSILLSPIIFLLCITSFQSAAQQLSNDRISTLIQEFKEDPRGPYRDIKWFCDDGTVREAREILFQK